MTRDEILARLVELDQALAKLAAGRLPKPVQDPPPPTAKVLPFRR